ncbi:Glyoxalase superfamily enzyme, possibly 3-demethylubiquinone-9 3-methyltransferase [Seinonella peptonophila]|uniref:Glyoxalase superfamily enzyme, possibly 3-demethylubiquinone-9 3-methyltransferase n=1 Tax=Seinonella peptonophila TaxID=112248 RepID=A0A1M5BM87_9BACL|nr:VOC family protein [Seinonella peptonophila]SHF43332.1 Glyoxalase superfamily enzyme, possibly 3-demethylubiquinone-9 3-methyltransferase [Seinonella peptonophila]
MQKIIPHLWFDHQAKEAAEFYVSIFGDQSKVTNIMKLQGTPSGDSEIVSFVLAGQEFMSINAGPIFQFNPSISFIVNCKTKEEVDTLWNQLFEDGELLIPLDSYPFSDRYGWLTDKYGLNWQIMLTDQDFTQKIVPSLLFTNDLYGKAQEAIQFYLSIFHDSKLDTITYYEEGEDGNQAGTVQYAEFTLENQKISAMENARASDVSFNEAVSLMVYCQDQHEIDYYWDKLSAVPEAEQCGWLKDRYGVSWQIVPRSMNNMLSTKDKQKSARITQAFLKMKKLDIAELEKNDH